MVQNGSKMQVSDSESRVGVTDVVHANGLLMHLGIFRLADQNSVINAELYALLQIILWVLRNISTIGMLRMFLDSLASLLAIRYVFSYQPWALLIKDIYSRITESKCIRVEISWVPAEHLNPEVFSPPFSLPEAIRKRTRLRSPVFSNWMCIPLRASHGPLSRKI